MRNCCMARMLPREAENGVGMNRSARGGSVKRFERSNGLDTALYKTIPLPLPFLQSRNVRKLRHPAMIATLFLECPPLGSLVVRLVTGDPIGISGVKHLCVAIRSLSCTRKNREINQLSLELTYGWRFVSFYVGVLEARATASHSE